MRFVIPQTIIKSDVNNFTSTNGHHVHFIWSVYYSDMRELIKYYLAIKVSSNAVRNIYKVSNLSIAYFDEKRKTVIKMCQSSGSNCCLEKSKLTCIINDVNSVS